MKVSYLAWQPWFGAGNARLDLKGICEVTAGTKGVLDAEVVVVHAPSILNSGQIDGMVRLRRAAGTRQIWMLETHESFVNYPDQGAGRFRELFDAEMSHRQAADVWSPYLHAGHVADYAGLQTGRRKELCCAFISSRFNGSGREEFLAELMRHMEIASYGRLMNNRRLAEDSGTDSKLRVLRQFRYTLAFENSIETDYVTEKFFEPLMTGTVPVYLGAPNIAEFAPGENSYIDASRFSSPAELARFLLTADDQAFHEWRKKPLQPSFRKMLERLSVPFEQRFVAAVERLRRRGPGG